MYKEHKNMQFGCVSGSEIHEGNTYLETNTGDILQDDLETVMTFYGLDRKVAGEEVEGE